MANESYFRLDGDNKMKYRYPDSIGREMDQWITYSHIHCGINGANRPHLRNTFHRIYLASVLKYQFFLTALFNYGNKMLLCAKPMIICTLHRLHHNSVTKTHLSLDIDKTTHIICGQPQIIHNHENMYYIGKSGTHILLKHVIICWYM